MVTRCGVMQHESYFKLLGMHATHRGSGGEKVTQTAAGPEEQEQRSLSSCSRPRPSEPESSKGPKGALMATTSTTTESSPYIRSLIPARIDRLPWSRFHLRLVTALGVAWILDGLEITIAANVGSDLTLKNTLNMSAGAVSDIAWWYLIGEVIGALFFGRLSDKLGRRNLFMITLGVYLIGSGLTAVTPNGGHWFIFLYATRIVAGMGIGGEYAAINSAIDEMIPAKFRGGIDVAANG